MYSNNDEFNYYAIAMVFGRNSPHLTEYKIYDIMKKYQDIKFSEYSSLSTENRLDTHRELKLSITRSFMSTQCQLSSGVNRVVSLVDATNKIHMSDALFSEREYEYFSSKWDVVIKNKIRTLGMLIRSVYCGKLIDIPLLINEFPEITGILLKYPDIWVNKL
jgi:hypothetical protein